MGKFLSKQRKNPNNYQLSEGREVHSQTYDITQSFDFKPLNQLGQKLLTIDLKRQKKRFKQEQKTIDIQDQAYLIYKPVIASNLRLVNKQALSDFDPSSDKPVLRRPQLKKNKILSQVSNFSSRVNHPSGNRLLRQLYSISFTITTQQNMDSKDQNFLRFVRPNLSSYMQNRNKQSHFHDQPNLHQVISACILHSFFNTQYTQTIPNSYFIFYYIAALILQMRSRFYPPPEFANMPLTFAKLGKGKRHYWGEKGKSYGLFTSEQQKEIEAERKHQRIKSQSNNYQNEANPQTHNRNFSEIMHSNRQKKLILTHKRSYTETGIQAEDFALSSSLNIKQRLKNYVQTKRVEGQKYETTDYSHNSSFLPKIRQNNCRQRQIGSINRAPFYQEKRSRESNPNNPYLCNSYDNSRTLGRYF